VNSTTTASATSSFSDLDLAQIDQRTRAIGTELFGQLRRAKPWFFQRQFWDDKILDWSMKDEKLKVQLFRFVDVLPMLKTNQAIVQRLEEYLGNAAHALPMFAGLGLKLGNSNGLSRAAVAAAAKTGASDFAKKFIAGTNVDEVLKAAKRERQNQRAFTLDILGEAVTSEVEADHYFNAYVKLLRGVSPTVNAWEPAPRLDQDAWGNIPRVNLSIKLSALDCHFDPIDADGVARRVGEKLRQLLRVARECKAFINVDMESYQKKDLTLRIFKEVLSESEFENLTDIGIVIQCYLKDSGADLIALRDWAKPRDGLFRFSNANGNRTKIMSGKHDLCSVNTSGCAVRWDRTICDRSLKASRRPSIWDWPTTPTKFRCCMEWRTPKNPR
jgi:RHH-type transcriptional regulator, proline utilization regulon repressor / proline dehydrogenase / delta 1-pyrroline-5-carboxylate dehydrogenase